MATVVNKNENFHELTDQEAREYFESQVQGRLQLSTTQFLAKVERGEYKGTDNPHVIALLSLLPFIKK